MDRQHAANLWEQIDAATTPVVVLSGPAGSGKTEAILTPFRRHSDASNRRKRLLIVPNRLTADHLKDRLLADSERGVILTPRIVTFDDLAQRILTSTAHLPPTAQLSAMRRRLMLRSIVADLDQAGTLTRLRRLRNAPGLLPAIEASLAELKRAAIAPEDLTGVIDPDLLDQDILAIYERFQATLQAEGLTDVEGRMWLARDVLSNAATHGLPVPGLVETDLVIADGFTEFTPTQLQILQLLSQRVSRTIITLPYAADGRERLWQWSQRTLRRLEATFNSVMTHVQTVGRTQGPLNAIASDLFADTPSAPLACEAFSLIRAAGKDAEIAAVARRIKRLIFDGTPASSIVIISRSDTDYADVLGRVLEDHDLPTSQLPRSLTEVPIIRFLLAVATLSPNYSAESVKAVIGNSYFCPEALGNFTAATAQTLGQALTEANVLAGLMACRQGIDRYQRRQTVEHSMSDDAAPPPPLPGPLFEAIVSLAELDLVSLIDRLNLRSVALQADSPDLIARDLRALAALQAAIPADGAEALSLPALTDALTQIPAPPARREQLISHLNALDARAIRYDHVFLVGLNEAVFPSRVTHSPLISEPRRRRWNSKGLELDIREDLLAREMLLFYLVCTRAETSLTISFLDSDANGMPKGVSAFLTALLDLVPNPDDIDTEVIPLGTWAGSATDSTMSRRDAIRQTISTVLADETPASAGILAWTMGHLPRSLRWAARGTYANECRWHRPGSAYDGILSDSALTAGLAEQYPRHAVFSAGQLECFHRCPWQYFARYLLGLEPTSQPAYTMDALHRGLYIHHVLFDFMTHLVARHGAWTELTDEGLDELLDAASAQAARRLAHHVPPTHEALRHVELAQLHHRIRQYLLTQRALHICRPVHFEWGFGMGQTTPDDDWDPTSDSHIAAFVTPIGPVRLRGRVDRIDEIDTPDGPTHAIVDYKTGRKPKIDDIADGHDMQLLLYTDIVAQRFDRPCIGGGYHRIAGTCDVTEFATQPISASRAVGPDAFEAAMDNLRNVVAHDITQLAAGWFPLASPNECPSWCSYRRICHLSKARAALHAEPVLSGRDT
jgi:ATP-dependent helicase/nuclease subunit B